MAFTQKFIDIDFGMVDLQTGKRRAVSVPIILAQVEGMDGTDDVLGRLKGRKSRIFQRAFVFMSAHWLRRWAWKPHFDDLFGTDDFGLLYKPNPQAYLNVCRLLGVKPEQCVMVDDSADNLHQAKALGMKTVWYGEKAHPLPFADGIAKDMQGLLEFCTKLP